MKDIRISFKNIFLPCMLVLLVLQLCAALWFCVQKQGYHYDEYYSYYSSNVTYGLTPTDGEWKDTSEIRSEFMVLADAGVNYEMVRLMQSWDVHPPLYYYFLHTVCALSKGVFSKWQGLFVNLVFYVLSWFTLWGITKELTGNDKKKIFAVCALFGFSPAVFSGITFIRMYMMLTFECLLLLYVHVRAIIKEKRTVGRFYLPVFILSFLGFHTHYYFAVFLFFVAATTCLSLLFKTETRKTAFGYGAVVVAGMLLSVLLYPACVGHIFRGYRGTEAQDAFFDMGNIFDRGSFFYSLTNEYVFGRMLTVLLLVMAIGTIILLVSQKRNEVSDGVVRKMAYIPVVVTTIGYFLVVAKTALMNAEEAIRYEMPVYGLLILLIVSALSAIFEKICKKEQHAKWSQLFVACMVVLTLVGEIYGLIQGKVCFLYPQDTENIAWAGEHQKEPVVYIYNPANKWMIWDDSEELMQYEEIYFVSSENDSLEPDLRLQEEDHVYVYMMRGEKTELLLSQLMQLNGEYQEMNLVRELLYCDLYEIKK